MERSTRPTLRRLSLIVAAVLPVSLALASPARAQSGDGYVVAVLPFASPDARKAQDLQKEIIQEIDELGGYTLIEQDAVNDAVRKQGLRPGAVISATDALEIGRMLDSRLVARGSLEPRGDDWVASPVFVEITTRNTQSLPYMSDDDMDDLGEKIVEAFNTRNQALKHLIFGIDYLRGENYERAIRNFEQALEYDENLAAAHYQMGEAYFQQGQLDQALAALERAVAKDPAYISAYHRIGTTYLERGDTLQAKGFFEELVRQQPEDCDIQVAYGYVMANQLGEVQKGLEAFEKAKRLCPEDPEPYKFLAYALPNERRDEKIENFERYLALSEGTATDTDVLEFGFSLYFGAEQYDKALTTVEAAIERDPSNADLWLYKGVVLDKRSRYREAIEAYDRALSINPEMERAYLFKALAYKELGNTQQYVANLEKAGRDASRIIASQVLRSSFDRLKAGQPSAAIESARRAIRLGADACAANYVIGAGLYDLGRFAQGEEKSMASNQRSIELFRQAIGQLQSACGTYRSYAQGLIGNATEYIDRGEKIVEVQRRRGL